MPRPGGTKFKIKPLRKAERIKRMQSLGRDLVEKAVLLLSQISRSGMNVTVVMENELQGLTNADVSMLIPTLNNLYDDGGSDDFRGPVISYLGLAAPNQLALGTYVERSFTPGTKTTQCLSELHTVVREMSRNDARPPRKLALTFSPSSRLLYSPYHRKDVQLNAQQSTLLLELLRCGPKTGRELVDTMQHQEGYKDTTNLSNGVTAINKKVADHFGISGFLMADPYRISPAAKLKEE